MKVSTIKSNWLPKGGFRLDCSPYLGGAIETEILLDELPVRKDSLDSVTSAIFNGPKFSRTFVDNPDHGVRFLGGSDLQKAGLDDLPLLSREQAHGKQLRHLEIKEGMTLITCSGTIGKMAYARQEMEGIWSSQHVMKVVPDSDVIPSGYLYAFLSSRFGVPLVVAGTYGSIIQSIEPHHISGLSIPRFGEAVEKKIHQLIENAGRLRSEANAIRRDASIELTELSGMDLASDSEPPDEPTYCIVPSNRLGSRLDTNYHSAAHFAAMQRIKDSRYGATTIGSIASSVVEMPRFKRIPLDDVAARDLFGTRDIGNVDPRPISRIAAFSGWESYSVRSASVLIPRSGQLNGIIGTAILPIGDLKSGVVSEHAIRVNACSDEMAGFVYLALNLPEGRIQLKARAFGGSIPTLDVHNIASVLVPAIEQPEMHRLGRLGFEVSELRTEAIRLERKARNLVENQILQRPN